MLWIKSLHIIFMVTWFCGIFYLPRLFVYHSTATDLVSQQRFNVMEKKLYYYITTPGAILTLIFGLWLIYFNPIYLHMLWLHLKLGLVLLLLVYHVYLGKLVQDFAQNRNRHGALFYRILNEVPVIFLVGIVVLVVVRPFGLIGH